jgi:uncharacterized membrane protein
LNTSELPLATPEIIRSIAIASAFTAACLSAWMWSKSIGVKGLPSCGKGSACDQVTKGRWSRWGAIPVIAFGTISYTALAAALIAAVAFPQSRHFSSQIASMDSLLALASSTWFVVLQSFVARRLRFYWSRSIFSDYMSRCLRDCEQPDHPASGRFASSTCLGLTGVDNKCSSKSENNSSVVAHRPLRTPRDNRIAGTVSLCDVV